MPCMHSQQTRHHARTVVPPTEHGEKERHAHGARGVDDQVQDEEDAPVPALFTSKVA